MRFRLMATYLGVPYQAGLGPDGTDVTLFSPAPPPEELDFTASGGHWRKQVGVTDLDALWQSRPVGEYRGEPCLVLDDLGSRLHIAYLGRDTTRAIQLGYWEIDREVFEVVVARQEVTGLIEQRVEFPLAAAMFPPSGAAAEVPPSAPPAEPAAVNGTAQTARPDRLVERGAVRGAFEPVGPADLQAGAAGLANGDHASRAPDRVAAWHGSPWPEPWPEPEPWSEPGSWDEPRPRGESGTLGEPGAFGESRTLGESGTFESGTLGESRTLGDPGNFGESGTLGEPGAWGEPGAFGESGTFGESGAWGKPGAFGESGNLGESGSWGEPGDRVEAAAVRPPARRGAGKDHVSPQAAFAELLGLAGISHAAYAVNEEVPGAMCLVKADGGFEVFSCTEDARLEVRFFEDEEAAYFYLFGVLAAEAIHSGRLSPRGPRVPQRPGGPGRANGHTNGSGGTGASPAPTENVSKYLRGRKWP